MRTIKILDLGRTVNGVAKIRVQYDKEWEEYQVIFLTDKNKMVRESMNYHCGDKEDAIDTAHYEFTRHLNMENQK